MRPPDPVTGEAARRAAEAELRRAEYHRDDPGLLDRLLRWFGRRLSDAFSGSTAGNALLLFAVLIIAVVVFLAVRAGPPRRERAGRRSGDPLAPHPAVDHRRLAHEHEAAGRYADALREWLRVVIATIEERGVLDPRPGRTGAATAREAGPSLPSVREELGRVVSVFDAVWFGARPATAGDAAAAHRLADAVTRARIEHPAPAGLVPPR